jgi:hypothetical protein
LLLAVVQAVVEPKPDDYDRRTEPSEFRAWLIWFGVATVKRITSYKYISLQRLAAAEALRFPEIGRTFYESVRPGYQMASELFAEAMKKGALRRADPQTAVIPGIVFRLDAATCDLERPAPHRPTAK